MRERVGRWGKGQERMTATRDKRKRRRIYFGWHDWCQLAFLSREVTTLAAKLISAIRNV